MAIPKVCVVMSTYNGSKYIKEQVDSILNQKDVDVSIVIRDDGSDDDTVQILSNYKRSKITVLEGENVGYANSFLICLKKANDSEYYAFADQDDIWLPDKLSRAITFLEDKYDIYASALTVVDEKKEFISEKNFNGFVATIGSVLSRNRIAGCTIVFNNIIYKRFSKYIDSLISYNTFNYGHDGWILLFALAFKKRLMVDSESRILYRRHDSSVTNVHGGAIKRIRNELKIFVNKDNKRAKICSYLLDNHILESQTDKDTVGLIVNYRNNLHDKAKLFFSKRLRTGIFIVDLKNKIALLLNKY